LTDQPTGVSFARAPGSWSTLAVMPVEMPRDRPAPTTSDRRVLRREAAAWTVGLVLVAFALRTWRLGDANVWWDEGLAVWAVRKPIIEATLWTAGDVHPPLFFWLLWGWIRMVGQSEFAIRSLSAALGVLTVVLAGALARRVAGPRAGLLALAIVAVARFEVWWSMELRMYMLAGVCVLAATFAVLAWLEAVGLAGRDRDGPARPPRTGSSPRWLIAYVIAAAAALYTVYWAVVALAILNLVVASVVAGSVRGRPKHEPLGTYARLAGWIWAQIAVVALFVPWLAVALPRMQSWSATPAEPASFGFIARLWATLMATGISTEIDRARWWVALFWVCAVVGPVVMRWFTRHRSVPDAARRTSGTARPVPGAIQWILSAFVLLPPLAVWAFTRPRAALYVPAVEARYFLPFAGLAYVAVAIMLAGAWRRSRAAGCVFVGGTLLALLATLPGHYESRRLRDAFQSMVLAIWSQAEPSDVVVLLSGNRYPLFLYDYDQPWTVERTGTSYRWTRDGGEGTEPGTRPPVVPFPSRGSETIDERDWRSDLDRYLDTGGRVWLAEVDAHLQDPDGRVEAYLDERSERVLSESFGPNSLHLYDRDGATPVVTGLSSRWPGVARPGDDPGQAFHPLVGAPTRRAMAGDEVNVTVWRTGTVPENVATPELLKWQGHIGRGDALGRVVPIEASSPGGTRARASMQVDDRLPSGWYDQVLQTGSTFGLRLAPLAVVGTEPPLVPGAPGLMYLTGAARSARCLPTTDATSAVARLAAACFAPQSVRRGESVVVDLYWQMPSTPTTPVVFAHLIGPPHPDTGDPVWAGQDGPPSSGAWGDEVFDRHVLTVDPKSPAGDYTIEVGLYDRATGERFPVTGGTADPANRRVVLGTVTVRR
jgi:uncharacterized membrane protein